MAHRTATRVCIGGPLDGERVCVPRCLETFTTEDGEVFTYTLVHLGMGDGAAVFVSGFPGWQEIQQTLIRQYHPNKDAGC